jgi:hypothetical protein
MTVFNWIINHTDAVNAIQNACTSSANFFYELNIQYQKGKFPDE